VAHQLGYVVSVESSLAQPGAKGGPEIVPDETFNLRVAASADKRMLDVWAATGRGAPNACLPRLLSVAVSRGRSAGCEDCRTDIER
jgi:hypothetical protein